MSVALPSVAPAAPPIPHSPPSRGHALRAVVRRTLRDQRRSVLSWGLSLGALCAFMAAIYPSISDSIQKATESYPSGLKQAFGIEEISSVESYVHAEMFSLIIPLAIGWFAIRAMERATVTAEERGHLDTILALPLSRRVLVAGSYVATALAALAVMAITGLMLFAAGRLAGTGISFGLTTAGVAGVWPLALFFGGVATLAAGVLHRSGTVSGVAVGALVAMYAMDLAGRLTDTLEPLRWASAFRYYGAPLRDGLDPLACAGLAAAGALLALAGALLFARRDVLA